MKLVPLHIIFDLTHHLKNIPRVTKLQDCQIFSDVQHVFKLGQMCMCTFTKVVCTSCQLLNFSSKAAIHTLLTN